MRVTKVETVRPPMTTSPMVVHISLPSEVEVAMGIMPRMVVKAVMRTGRIRLWPLRAMASLRVIPLSRMRLV